MPDGLRLRGRLDQVEGLWSAQAIWITHAVGVARAPAAQRFDEPADIGQLVPYCFANEPRGALRRRAVAADRASDPHLFARATISRSWEV